MELSLTGISLVIIVLTTILVVIDVTGRRRKKNIKRLKESAFARDIKLMIRREHDDKIIEKNRGVTPNA